MKHSAVFFLALLASVSTASQLQPREIVPVPICLFECIHYYIGGDAGAICRPGIIPKVNYCVNHACPDDRRPTLHATYDNICRRLHSPDTVTVTVTGSDTATATAAPSLFNVTAPGPAAATTSGTATTTTTTTGSMTTSANGTSMTNGATSATVGTGGSSSSSSSISTGAAAAMHTAGVAALGALGACIGMLI